MQDTPARYEDAAKLLVTIIALSLTLIIATIDKLIVINIDLYDLSFVLFFWLFALLFAFMVLWPQKYSFSSKSVESIKTTHAEIIRTKRRLFFVAASSYWVSLLILVTSVIAAIVR